MMGFLELEFSNNYKDTTRKLFFLVAAQRVGLDKRRDLGQEEAHGRAGVERDEAEAYILALKRGYVADGRGEP